MKCTAQISARPSCLWVNYECSFEGKNFMFHVWCSQGLDAVLVIKLLDKIPDRVCFRDGHPNKDFAGRLISTGQLGGGEVVFAASLYRISDDVFRCADTPFACLKGQEIDVLVEVERLRQSLYLKILYDGSFPNCHDR